MHQQGPDPGDLVVRPGEPPGQRLAGLQGGQRRGVTVSLKLERPADDEDPQYALEAVGGNGERDSAAGARPGPGRATGGAGTRLRRGRTWLGWAPRGLMTMVPPARTAAGGGLR